MIRTLLESVTGYPGLLLACAASGILLPFPEDFPLMYAGMRIADGSWGWWGTVSVAFVGVSLRDLLSWTFGRAVGELLMTRPGFRRFFGGRRIDRAHALVTRHGAAAVLLGRFMVGFRAPVFAMAGAMGVPMRAFATWDALGLAIAVPLAIVLGYAFGQPLADTGLLLLQRARLVVAAVAVVATALWIWRMAVQRTREDERESAP